MGAWGLVAGHGRDGAAVTLPLLPIPPQGSPYISKETGQPTPYYRDYQLSLDDNLRATQAAAADAIAAAAQAEAAGTAAQADAEAAQAAADAAQAVLDSLGVWQDVPYDAGNFTAYGSMTWTVASGDVVVYSYYVIGKAMVLTLNLINTSIGGTPDSLLSVKVPSGYVLTEDITGYAYWQDNGTPTHGLWYVETGSSTTEIYLELFGGGNFAASTNATQIQAVMILAVESV